MNIKKKAAVATLSLSVAVGAQLYAVPSANATGTLRASCPAGSTMSVILQHNNGGTTCFSGTGSLATNLTGITEITASKSGHLWANVAIGGPSVRIDFRGGTCLLKSLAKVTSVSVY